MKLKDENKMFKEQVEESSEALKTAEVKIADLEAKIKTSYAEQEILNRDANKVSKYNCGFCEKTFLNKNEMNEHVVDHKRDNTSQTMIPPLIDRSIQTETFADRNTAYCCFYCGFLIESTLELEIHKSLKCENAVNLPDFNCNPCDEELVEENEVEHQYTSYTSLYWCDFCDNSFEHLEGLQSHMRSDHANILPR